MFNFLSWKIHGSCWINEKLISHGHSRKLPLAYSQQVYHVGYRCQKHRVLFSAKGWTDSVPAYRLSQVPHQTTSRPQIKCTCNINAHYHPHLALRPALPRCAPLCPATPSPDVRFTRSTAVRTCRLFQRHQNVIYVFSSCNTRVPTVFCYARGRKGRMVNDSDGFFIYIFYRFQRGRYKSDLYGKQ